MKAAQINEYGDPKVLQTTASVPEPEPGEGQVLVNVKAAGVNPFDITVAEGRAQAMKQLEFPATLGADVAGIVAPAGPGTGGFEPGQAIYGQANALSGQGSFAEFTAVNVAQLAAKPTSLDFTEAAALPLAGTSAYQALVDHMDLQPGQKILIHGAAGGIGSIAVQLAKYLKAYVATTVGTNDIQFAKELGADEVIDYKSQDFTQLIRDYDAVFDTVGGETNQKSYQVLKPRGILVAMSAQPDDQLVEKYRIRYIAQFSRVTTERLTKLAELVDKGVIKVYVDKVFSLDRAGEALEHLKTGHPRGKVVIRVKK